MIRRLGLEFIILCRSVAKQFYGRVLLFLNA